MDIAFASGSTTGRCARSTARLLHGTLGEPLRDPDYFRRARVDEEARTVVWPNGLDPVPELLHGGNERPASPSGYEPELVEISRHAGTTQRPRRGALHAFVSPHHSRNAREAGIDLSLQ